MKPILFNTEMVQAVLKGRKTQTRRSIKIPENFSLLMEEETEDGKKLVSLESDLCPQCYKYVNSQYQVGDVLYVRETWSKAQDNQCIGYSTGECPHKGGCDNPSGRCFEDHYIYKASDNLPTLTKWHPSLHMKKEAARIFLKVTDVRVGRVQDITGEQAEKEGCGLVGYKIGTNEPVKDITLFQITWDETVKPSDIDNYGWNANPWVWVYTFERCEKE